jgi:hypothetical protein
MFAAPELLKNVICSSDIHEIWISLIYITSATETLLISTTTTITKGAGLRATHTHTHTQVAELLRQKSMMLLIKCGCGDSYCQWNQ